eukprot:440087-Pelagomonas_calceolata.AAC.2
MQDLAHHCLCTACAACVLPILMASGPLLAGLMSRGPNRFPPPITPAKLHNNGLWLDAQYAIVHVVCAYAGEESDERIIGYLTLNPNHITRLQFK